MSRTVSAAFKQAIFAQETNEAFMLLVTISHASLAAPIRVCANGQDIVSNGNTFVGFPVQISLPSDEDDNAPTANMTIDNIDLQIIIGLRALTSPPNVDVAIVLASNPNLVEISMPTFKLRNVTYDSMTVTGELKVDDLTEEPYPADQFSPPLFPGIF